MKLVTLITAAILLAASLSLSSPLPLHYLDSSNTVDFHQAFFVPRGGTLPFVIPEILEEPSQASELFYDALDRAHQFERTDPSLQDENSPEDDDEHDLKRKKNVLQKDSQRLSWLQREIQSGRIKIGKDGKLIHVRVPPQDEKHEVAKPGASE